MKPTVKSLASARTYQLIGPFTVSVVRSDMLANGSIIIDICETAQDRYCFIVWYRHLTADPRCDGCITHRWKSILPTPNSRVHDDIGAAWLAASTYVIENKIDTVDDTPG